MYNKNVLKYLFLNFKIMNSIENSEWRDIGINWINWPVNDFGDKIKKLMNSIIISEEE